MDKLPDEDFYSRSPLEVKTQEKLIKKIKETYGKNVWVFKTHDLCRKSIPDLILCFYGHFVSIELKRECSNGHIQKSNSEPLQQYNIECINGAGGTAFFATNILRIMEKLEKIKVSILDWNDNEK